MTAATKYALGIDLGRTPWTMATARDASVDSFAVPAPAPDGSTAEHIAAAIRPVLATEGGTLAAVVVAFAPDAAEPSADLLLDLSRLLGLAPGTVRTIGAASAVAIGLAHLGTDDAAGSPSAAAVGAALSGLEDDTRSAAGWGAAAAAGAAGAAAATLGAGATDAIAPASGTLGPAGTTLGQGAPTIGPTGVPLAHGAGAVGPAGSPLAQGLGATGPTGVPLGQGTVSPGPTGVSMGQGGAATGPGGVPLVPAIRGALRSRWLLVGGAAAAVVVVVVGVVVATGDDKPVSRGAAPSTTTIVTSAPTSATDPVQTTEPAATVESTAVATTDADTTTPAVATSALVPGQSSCVVGSWTADNDAYLAEVHALTAALPVTWDGISGTVHVGIDAGGTVTTTYDDWKLTSTLGGAGEGFTSVNGVDTNTVTFGDDGTYNVTSTVIGSHTVVGAGGIIAQDTPSAQTLLDGTLSYSCSGDDLSVHSLQAGVSGPSDYVLLFHRDG